MWDKNLREVLFLILYQHNFVSTKIDDASDRLGFDSNQLENFDFYESLVSRPAEANLIDVRNHSKVLEEKLLLLLDLFDTHKNSIIQTLSPLVTDWSKTNLMLQAFMFEYILEKKQLKDSDSWNSKKILNNYLHLANKYLESSNIATLHAVISKDLGLQNLAEVPNNL